jgi:hypothetical protein
MEYAYRVWHTKKQVPTFYAGFPITGAQNFKKEFQNSAITSLKLNHFGKLAAFWKAYTMLYPLKQIF